MTVQTDDTMPRTAGDLEVMLLQLFDAMSLVHPDDLADVDILGEMAEALQESSVGTFDGRGVMTNNRGLVVKFANGAEYQITIVQSEDAGDACELCGEQFSRDDERAEMGEPNVPGPAFICHAQCGLDQGFEVA